MTTTIYQAYGFRPLLPTNLKQLYTNRSFAPLYKDKLAELGWRITTDVSESDIISLKTKGMFSLLQSMDAPETIWGIPLAFHVVGKQNLWLYINKYFGNERAQYICPQTYILNNEIDVKSLKKALSLGNSIVLKSNRQRRQNIQVVSSIDEFEQKLHTEHVVGQLLKKNTLEFENRKFHFRYYMAISIINGQLRVFLHPKSRVVFAKPKDEAQNEFERYITMNENYEEWLPMFGFDLVGKKVLSLNTYNRILKLLKISLKPFNNVLLKHTSAETKYYDLFGVDIIFLENHYPLLVEINRSPSMSTINKKDEILKKSIIDSFLRTVNEGIEDFKGWGTVI